jgi:hypothetical protein
MKLSYSFVVYSILSIHINLIFPSLETQAANESLESIPYGVKISHGNLSMLISAELRFLLHRGGYPEIGIKNGFNGYSISIARIRFDSQIYPDPSVRLKMEAEFSSWVPGSNYLKEAWVSVSLSSGGFIYLGEITAGAMRVSFLSEFMTDEMMLPTIDYSMMLYSIAPLWDVGVQYTIDLGRWRIPLKIYTGIYNGRGLNNFKEQPLPLKTFRGEFRPLSLIQKPDVLRLGAAMAYNFTNSYYIPEFHINKSFTADIRFNYDVLSAGGEVLHSDTDEGRGYDSRGWRCWIGIDLIPEFLKIVASYERLRVGYFTKGKEIFRFIAGLNLLYISNHLEFRYNYFLYGNVNKDPESGTGHFLSLHARL